MISNTHYIQFFVWLIVLSYIAYANNCPTFAPRTLSFLDYQIRDYSITKTKTIYPTECFTNETILISAVAVWDSYNIEILFDDGSRSIYNNTHFNPPFNLTFYWYSGGDGDNNLIQTLGSTGINGKALRTGLTETVVGVVRSTVFNATKIKFNCRVSGGTNSYIRIYNSTTFVWESTPNNPNGCGYNQYAAYTVNIPLTPNEYYFELHDNGTATHFSHIIDYLYINNINYNGSYTPTEQPYAQRIVLTNPFNTTFLKHALFVELYDTNNPRNIWDNTRWGYYVNNQLTYFSPYNYSLNPNVAISESSYFVGKRFAFSKSANTPTTDDKKTPFNTNYYQTYLIFNSKLLNISYAIFPNQNRVFLDFKNASTGAYYAPVNEPAYFYDEESQSWYFLPPFAPTNTSLIYTSSVLIIPTESRTPQPKPVLPIKVECYGNKTSNKWVFQTKIILYENANITTYTVNTSGGFVFVDSANTSTYLKEFDIISNTTFIVKVNNRSICSYSTTTPINIQSINLTKYKSFFAYPLFSIMIIFSTAFPLLSPFIIIINELFDIVSATIMAVMILLSLLIGMTVNWRGTNTLRVYLSYITIAFAYLILTSNYFTLNNNNDIFASQTQQEAIIELNTTISNFASKIPINQQTQPDLNYEVYIYPKLLFDLIYLFLSTPYTIINIIKLSLIYVYPELSGVFALISGILVLALYGGLLLIGIRILLKPYIDF